MLPDNTILDIILSVVLIYALLSILVSILTEWVTLILKTRSKLLKKSILQLLNDPLNVHFGELFYSHYLVDGLYYRGKRKRAPQYISSKLFADVLIDLIVYPTRYDTPVIPKGNSGMDGKQYQSLEKKEYETVLDYFKAGLSQLKPSPLVDTLRSFVEKSKTLDELKENLRFWYDDYMDRVSGWFKFDQRIKLRIVGFAVAIALNVDSLHLIKIISYDDVLRANLVNTAERVAENYQTLSDSLKQNPSALLKTFNPVLTDSSKNDSTKRFVPAPLRETIDHLNDSLSRKYLLQADSVLGIVAALNIPLGWDSCSAPLTWIPKKDTLQTKDKQKNKDNQKSKNKQQKTEVKKLPGGNGLLAYTQRRNVYSTGNLVYYLLGISITGISLSFGAPFWFDALVKLINIRKAGKKPEAVNTPK